MRNVLAILLVGGKGERLHPLTLERAKPAVPFGGIYRLIDFTLSNSVNSGFRRIYILTQYKSDSLNRHVRNGWSIFHHEFGEFIELIPAQQRVGEEWYQGTSDAVYQNLHLLEHGAISRVIILSGDHVYKMDYSKMLDFHEAKGADMTVGALEVPRAEGHRFGILRVNEDERVIDFREKPTDPWPVPGKAGFAFGSMGIYVFNKDVLVDVLRSSPEGRQMQDFGRDVIPSMLDSFKVYAYNFIDENKKEAQYWKDVGTIDAYYDANIDLVSVSPVFNLYDPEWPIRTYQPQNPPAKFVFAQEFEGGRMGVALDSIVSGGCIVSGGRVRRSVLSSKVRINSFAEVEDSILFDGVDVGRYCRIRSAIIDKYVQIPPRMEIGFDLDKDKERFTVTDSGIVVIAKGTKLKPPPVRFWMPSIERAGREP
ncbi:MAG: glucose-1-phosphate adenylyltransferase [Candidatus Abyssobacteria bacterium SURF_17]|uniref:Glucose-1-phosphate adenylyltransferase n=1 Tax=Candidatus Abyssobacteria bacterium SURF_17 TaxID=2093361 RepID=A0A419F682_9BACT|nr:MAG: glucose-1-phosphate adenylyltransferase [Candidatus Abyssubacteria bacterium SURF_17]